MQFFRKWPIHIILFIMGFLLLNMITEFLFLSINGESMIVMYDMKKAKDVDIVFMGSSLSRTHISNMIIEKGLEKNSFNLSVSSARIFTSYAMMKELFKYQTPKTVVLVYDPVVSYNRANAKEAIVVETGLWPFLNDWNTKFTYALESSKIDGAYLDRFFPWRSFYPQNITDLWDNIQKKMNWDVCYNSKVNNFSEDEYYDGKGFCARYKKKNEKNLHAVMNQKVREIKVIDTSLLEDTLREMKCLCEKNNCELLLITVPQLPQVLLGDARYNQAYTAARSLCPKYSISFLEFAYTKEQFLPDMTEYFYSDQHMNGDGAKIFSSTLARVLKEYFAGQDVSSYFYTHEEYAQLKNYVLNGWYTENLKDGKITYIADSIYGSTVKPEYQFIAVNEKGEETILQDYYSTQKYTIAATEMEGKKIRISVRNAANRNQEPVIAIKK